MLGYSLAKTGIACVDDYIGDLQIGESVIWQVESVAHYADAVSTFVEVSRERRRDIIYFRFADHPPLVAPDDPDVRTIMCDPTVGFEAFTAEIHMMIAESGFGNFFIFDSLSSMLPHWRTDTAITNFLQVSIPFLFEYDAISYIGIVASDHTFTALATIHDVSHVVIDICEDEAVHLRVLKAWLRHRSGAAFTLTDGTFRPSAADELQRIARIESARDDPVEWWTQAIVNARHARTADEQEHARRELIEMTIGSSGRMVDLCRAHLSLDDTITIASRVVGTGFIGGKSIGMLTARAILDHDPDGRFSDYLEQHDSYFLGADLFYAFIIANGWWETWMEQRSPRGYFTAGASLHDKLRTGKFPPNVRDQFIGLLEYFGTDPIIVRSSSLLEDNFGNAFAGKYESVFCANQGSLAHRLQAFEDAVRTVYSSVMSADALEYRRSRGLDGFREQMAILVQRVSGSHHGDYYYPHAAGVGNSSNFYVWDPDIDPDAGMLRLVFGLGTRAVDRTLTDYARLVTLDNPARKAHGEAAKHSQRYVDVLDVVNNAYTTLPVVDIESSGFGADPELFFSVDTDTLRWLRDNNRPIKQTPRILDFQGLLTTTPFAELMRDILAAISGAYDHPVDIEYTLNIIDGKLRVNIVQCRPLQTRGLGRAVEIPTSVQPDDLFFSTRGNFMGGNAHLPIDYVIYVRPDAYLALKNQDRYSVARAIGVLNKRLKDTNFMVIAPGRWGTTTPSLGIPVTFTEINHATVMAEFTYSTGGFIPELSQGSHFFQDLVESGIFYVALFDRQSDTVFNPELATSVPNQLYSLVPHLLDLGDVIHVSSPNAMVLFSDIATQTLLCARGQFGQME